MRPPPCSGCWRRRRMSFSTRWPAGSCLPTGPKSMPWSRSACRRGGPRIGRRPTGSATGSKRWGSSSKTGQAGRPGGWMFEIVTDLSPCGDQPQAIDALAGGLEEGLTHQVLLGVTGSGKTFSIAQVINRVQKTTLVIAPNKTLAGQLYGELKHLFPHNAVEYFVSYYDYYQPEAYIPQSDTYIQKDSSINESIDKMRHAAKSDLVAACLILSMLSVITITTSLRPTSPSPIPTSRKIRTSTTRSTRCATPPPARSSIGTMSSS
ncbi:exported hypothetical protein [uncultured Desulfatiglans sp.]|uniref:Helicase ATP-binding domain-containing protein n=1 Tax=Uncultured Desulfatiglans sp. TaxID=1748965 RepID=A0A653A439_UNCDX|nr:exported hypothetical protein [uncultured Desulfatiglans sp.]